LDAKLGLTGEGYSPAVLRKIVVQGAKAPSFASAADDLERLAEVTVSPKHVQRLTERVGGGWADAEDADVERFKAGRLPRRDGRVAAPAAAVMLDAGRVQVRADDGGPAGVRDAGWKADQVACCLTLDSAESASDPQPEPPSKYLDPEKVRRLVTEMKGRSGPAAARAGGRPAEAGKPPEPPEPAEGSPKRKKKKKKKGRPAVRVRTVVADMGKVEDFGFKVAAEVHRRGLDLCGRKAFVGDGDHAVWGVFELHFAPLGFLAVLDFLHLLTYLYAAAQAAHGKGTLPAWVRYETWVRQAWSGRTAELLAGLKAAADKLGPPPPGAADGDPRGIVAAALTYVTNNRGRMDYPECRRLGLPTSSAPVESAVKQMNLRVKGTEKFWTTGGERAVLAVRSAFLSGDGRADRNFRRPRPHRAPAPARFRRAS
jgi:hypothetical protein